MKTHATVPATVPANVHTHEYDDVRQEQTESSNPLVAEIQATDTLGAIINAHPSLARDMELRGLDYCCGGGRTLAQACADLGLDTAVVITELTKVKVDGAPADWATMEVDALVDHLVTTHHRFLWDAMPRLSELTAKISSVHGERHPELAEVASCYEAVRADLEPHLLKEERVLFPLIGELTIAMRDTGASTPPSFHCGTLRNPISVMLREHDEVGALLEKLRALTNGYDVPADGCASYEACFRGLAELEADTHLHIHKENNLLFPMIVRMEDELAQRFPMSVTVAAEPCAPGCYCNPEPGSGGRLDLTQRADIERLVVAFYRDAAMDDYLGPVFEAAKVDWPSHLSKLADFWSWQLLGQRGYEGNPLLAHRPAHACTPFTEAHFDRWLELFEDTIDRLFQGPNATTAKQRASKMASAMQRLLLGPTVLQLTTPIG